MSFRDRLSPFESSILVLVVGALLLGVTRDTAAQSPPASPPSTLASPSPSAAASPVPLDSWLTSGSLWQTTPDHFPDARAFGFRWVSQARDAARASSRALRLGDLPVSEVIVRFATT